MRLPRKSTWHPLKGTWFVFIDAERSVHLHWKNSGNLLVYVNGELVEKKRSFRPRFDFSFNYDGSHFEIKTYPMNKTMTSFNTDLTIDGLMVRSFNFVYKRELKQYLPFMGVIALLTIPMVLLKLPTWSLYIMVFIVLAIKYILFSKQMFVIEESDNAIQIDI